MAENALETPLVSVICLCYNQAEFVEEAIQSVQNQTYGNIELIVMDDASTDKSWEVITNLGGEFKKVLNADNLGNCRSFNKAFAMSSGDFVIDFAADDVLLTERVELGVKAFMDQEIGIHHGNMMLIDKGGSEIDVYHKGADIPQGDIYRDLLARHFIGGPSMMVRRSVLEEMNGYDEDLAYEDFDFWVRSARNHKYLYSPEILVKKRILSKSHSRNQYKFGSEQLRSTYKVCVKASELNRTEEEDACLNKRIKYEMRKSLETGNLRLAWDFFTLLNRRS